MIVAIASEKKMEPYMLMPVWNIRDILHHLQHSNLAKRLKGLAVASCYELFESSRNGIAGLVLLCITLRNITVIYSCWKQACPLDAI